jgi:hypothetical protein
MPRYTESEARTAIAESKTLTEALRRLGVRPAGGNHAVLRRWAGEWGIPTDHLDSHAVLRSLSRARKPLDEVMVNGSTYDRTSLKRRLLAQGLKEARCELCGQDEHWHGRRMSLILDHVNGVADDHRLENLRIVCPNCAATLDTHCARNMPRPACRRCGARLRSSARRYCSYACWNASEEAAAQRASRRVVERPDHDELMAALATASHAAVGRRYGVSATTIYRWVRRGMAQPSREPASEAPARELP